MYDSILLNPESSDLHKIDHIFIDELRREAKPYYTLFRKSNFMIMFNHKIH